MVLVLLNPPCFPTHTPVPSHLNLQNQFFHHFPYTIIVHDHAATTRSPDICFSHISLVVPIIPLRQDFFFLLFSPLRRLWLVTLVLWRCVDGRGRHDLERSGVVERTFVIVIEYLKFITCRLENRIKSSLITIQRNLLHITT